MSCVSRACLCALLLAFSAPVAADEGPAPQYVLISFDGALHLEQWERSRELARQTGAVFTYFLSCTYLLTPQTRHLYKPPSMAPGRSNVGFGHSREDVAGRLAHIWAARGEGHEIADHGCGHFDGAAWSEAEWTVELDQFREILASGWALNGIPGEPEGWRDFASGEIAGFRAPYLSSSDAMFAALLVRGYLYDASTVSNGPARPAMREGLLRFSLPMIAEGPAARPVIAMDYNLFVRHSGGMERTDADGAFEERTLEAFRRALDEQLSGERIPLQIGFHFTLMNGGAYWRALERFAREACAMREVRCVSYRGFIAATLPEGQ